MSVMDAVEICYFKVTSECPAEWSTFYSQLLHQKLFDQNTPKRSFLRYAFRKGVKHNQPVFAAHYIARVGLQVVGIGTINRLATPVDLLDYANLYVQPEYRRQGIGQQLIRRMLTDYPHLWGCRTGHSGGLYARSGVCCLSPLRLKLVIDLYMQNPFVN